MLKTSPHSMQKASPSGYTTAESSVAPQVGHLSVFPIFFLFIFVAVARFKLASHNFRLLQPCGIMRFVAIKLYGSRFIHQPPPATQGATTAMSASVVILIIDSSLFKPYLQ